VPIKRRAAPRLVVGAVKGCRSEWKLFSFHGLRDLLKFFIAQSPHTISSKVSGSTGGRKLSFYSLRNPFFSIDSIEKIAMSSPFPIYPILATGLVQHKRNAEEKFVSLWDQDC
jgi:hypothetical protein